jgi:hypothetical protein
VLSISGDALLILTAVPLFVKVNLPTRQKVILMMVFGMGIFIVIAGILTKVYCLVPGLVSYVYMNWYFREATVSILVTSLPLVWSLIREVFPAVDSWVTPSSGRTNGQSRYRGTGGTITGNLTQRNDVQLQKFDRLESRNNNKVSVSVTHVNQKDDSTEITDDDNSDRALRVRQDISFTIEYEHGNAANRDGEGASVTSSVRA